MGKQDVEFQDSTLNVKVKFDENDMKALDETETTEASHSSVPPSSGEVKFDSTLIALISFGALLTILYKLVLMTPLLVGFISIIFINFLYEWQRIHSPNLSRVFRASFNFKNLLEKDENYIPYYTLSWLFGEKYKPYIIPCNIGTNGDDRTANEPEAVSPVRDQNRDIKRS